MCEASIIFFSELRWHKTICMGLVGENKTIDKGWHRNAYMNLKIYLTHQYIGVRSRPRRGL